MMRNFCLLGFLAILGSVSAQDACAAPATLTAASGLIQTNNPYANSQKCRWIVNGAAGKIIEMEFGRFGMESSSSCNYDYVVIHDSDVDTVLSRPACSSLNNARPNKIGPFCGNNRPNAILTAGNRAVVEFCSDSSQTGPGFEIRYKQVTPPPPTAAPPTGNTCNEVVVVDGRHTLAHFGNAGYQPFLKCSYSYTSKNGKALKVNSQQFNMEGIIGCRYDRVSLFDGDNSGAASLGIFCGTNGPKNVRTTGSQLHITFVSDEYTNGKGFVLTIEESCFGDHLCGKDASGEGADVCYSDRQICDGQNNCPINGEDESACAADCGGYDGWNAGDPFPGAAAITHVDGQIHCGGALINSQFVLTTAHCFHRLDDRPERFVVKLGASRLSDAYVSQIDAITVHPLFNPKTLANNLALVKLRKPAPLQSSISPFCLPLTSETSTLAEGSQCYTLGWGRTNWASQTSYATSVKQITATVLNNSRCKWSTSPVVVDTSSICASTSGGQLCYGDNGAPLVCKHRNGKWQLYGVNSVSFGCTGTATTPSQFVKVSSFASWITQTAF
ncbi:ovochymase-like [Paramacrobiotus metropolitanus]|uniref:ovochymase-like n=1 Tax=Paramacrobiotus metropolitanus TaxID=2943436 RepID=UPI002445D28D|nr:ovochymase-like [Paramacrobiotus metropolitanus]